MPEREELILEVRTELDRARNDVRDLERELEDLEEGFEDSETAAQRASRTIVDMARDTDRQLREAKEAADALGQALGPELTAKTDLDQVVTDLEKMGLSMTDIKADADSLAAAIREVDQIKVDGLRDGIDHSRTSMTGLRDSADQSRSVLANLAGNASQDLGELGGVAGTAGVALGQLAEYAVDGNIALRNLAGVAGPLLGVALATTAVSTALAGMRAEDAFRSELVDEFREAIREADSAIESLRTKVEEAGRLDFSDEGGFLGLGQQTEDLLPVLARLGLGFDEFMQLVEDSAHGSGEATQAFLEQINEGSNVFGNFNADADALADGIDQYADAIVSAEEAQRIFNQTVPLTGERLNEMLDEMREPMETLPELWQALIRDVADGRFDFENAATAVSQLTEATGLTRQEVLDLITAEAEAGNQIDKTTGVIDEAVQAQREHAAAIAETNAELAVTIANLDMAALRASAFTTALGTGFSELDASNETREFNDGLVTLHETLHDLDAALSDADFQNIDLVPDSWEEIRNMPDELVPVVEALTSFRQSVQSEFTQAFEQGGSTEAREWAESTRAAIVEELRLAGIESEEQVNQVLSALGLLPEQVETTISIANEEQARGVIGEIQSALDQLPAEVQTQIALLAPTDPVGALDLAIEALQRAGVEVPVSLIVQAEQLGADIDAATAKIKGAEFGTAPLTITPVADMSEFETAVDDSVSKERTATIGTEADTQPADTALDLVALERRTAVIDTVADVATADNMLDAVAGQRRVAVIDVALGSVPTASEIRNRIGTVTVNVQALVNARIYGNR